jgi:hypothetical protein
MGEAAHETQAGEDLSEVRVADPEHWHEGPPHELIKRLRNECPVHWSSGMSSFPG